MNADLLLTRLDGVRRAGPGWRANCPNPVHTKARGTLSITEAEDGRVLLACFACHDTPAILAALGMEMADLFPERIKDTTPEGRRAAREAFKQASWRTALAVLGRESRIVLLAAHDLLNHKPLTAPDVGRLGQAVERIERTKEALA